MYRIALLIGCHAPAPRSLSSRDDAPTPVAIARRDSMSSVRVSLISSPSRLRYRPELFGAERGSLTLQVTNDGRTAASLDDLDIGFSARREGVAFPCRPATAPDGEHGTLQPGRSAKVHRDISCSLSLPGRYDVDVFAALRDGALTKGAQIARMSIAVETASDAPAAIPSMPGVYAVIHGARKVGALSDDAWKRGVYRVALAVTNGSSEVVRLPTARLSFLTLRRGSPLGCAGESDTITFDRDILPGQTQVTRVTLACAPSEEGNYTVLGHLTLEGATTGTDVGGFSLEVENDSTFIPSAPPFSDRPGSICW